MRDGDKREILFKNAPLQEVVVEFHWELQPLSSMPGAAVDPYHVETLGRLSANLIAIGMPILETKVPDHVPREVVPHQATKIFRAAPNAWPVYQLGPGVFTANYAPPYHGWRKFFAFLKEGVAQLSASHPSPDRLKISQVALRYINFLHEGHGLNDVNEFLRTHLGVDIHLPETIENSVAEGGDIFMASEIRLPLKAIKNALGIIEWRPVSLGSGKVGLGLDFNIILNIAEEHQHHFDQVLDKVDAAHEVICDWFKSIATDDLWSQLEPEYEG